MKTLVDPNQALANGLAALRLRFKVPGAFPPEVVAAAETAAQRPLDGHADRTDLPFVTLDPATSTDLDQAFAIERSGEDLILRYAIADVAWFVEDGDLLDQEAWRRGATVYLPDGKAGLYPPVLSEGAASLLPAGPRPAVVFLVRVRPDGSVALDGVERAIIRSRAKLAYETVTPAELPPDFPDLAARIRQAEAERGASRVDPPEQEVASNGDGRLELRFRRRTQAEDQNAALSLATNLAVAQAFRAHGVGLFRVMAEPDARALKRLRLTARAFGLTWPELEPLAQFQRSLDPAEPRQAAFMLAIRRAGTAAGYMPYRTASPPWHAAVAAPYVHATAPLRRLADRYVVRAALSLANGERPSAAVLDAFERLPPVMARADAQAGQLERAVIDMAEAIMLRRREGEVFSAVVTDLDERGARIQLCTLPVVARISASGVEPGAELQVRLTATASEPPAIAFEHVG